MVPQLNLGKGLCIIQLHVNRIYSFASVVSKIEFVVYEYSFLLYKMFINILSFVYTLTYYISLLIQMCQFLVMNHKQLIFVRQHSFVALFARDAEKQLVHFCSGIKGVYVIHITATDVYHGSNAHRLYIVYVIFRFRRFSLQQGPFITSFIILFQSATLICSQYYI